GVRLRRPGPGRCARAVESRDAGSGFGPPPPRSQVVFDCHAAVRDSRVPRVAATGDADPHQRHRPSHSATLPRRARPLPPLPSPRAGTPAWQPLDHLPLGLRVLHGLCRPLATRPGNRPPSLTVAPAPPLSSTDARAPGNLSRNT